MGLENLSANQRSVDIYTYFITTLPMATVVIVPNAKNKKRGDARTSLSKRLRLNLSITVETIYWRWHKYRPRYHPKKPTKNMTVRNDTEKTEEMTERLKADEA